MQFLNKKREKPTIRPSSTANVEDTFVADILVFSYELLMEVAPPLYCGDPEKHPIFAIIYEIYNEQAPAELVRGIIVREKDIGGEWLWDGFGEVWAVPDERAILSVLVNLVFRVDPDILMTWDMERRGIRYLAERGIAHGINIANCLSRACDME
jgi:DNA polymerase elongation subunit (family B)